MAEHRGMGVAFRTAMPHDAESIVRFWLESGASMSVTDTVEDVRRVTANSAARMVLAVDGDDIVGTLLGTFDGWRGNMYRLVVRPDRRRQGIGRQIVRQMEQLFDAWGVRRVTILIEVDRPGAVAFWSAVGYPRDERIVRHVRNTERTGARKAARLS
jgi:GNAT superfamily N-acetyltransferase